MHKQLLAERLLTEQLLLRLAETSSHVHITERVLYTEVKRKCSTAKTNLEFLLLERLLLHLCESARARRRKGCLPILCGEKGSVARHRHHAAIGFGIPIRPLLLIPDEVFTGDHTVKVRTLARSDTSDADGILLASRNVASPGYFRYPYRRRFRTTYVRCFGDCLTAPRRPWHSRPLVVERPPFRTGFDVNPISSTSDFVNIL